MTGPSQDNQRHGQAIRRMLLGINSSPANPFVLNGGTALMECYGLDRFSEDIDLDALRSNVPSSRFFGVIDSVCSREGYSWRKAKDTPTVRRRSRPSPVLIIDHPNTAVPNAPWHHTCTV